MKIYCETIVEDGLAGTESQCLGVVDAFVNLVPFIDRSVTKIKLKQPWMSLSPYLGFEQGWSFVPPLLPPWPDLLITAGRKAIAASRYVKRRSRGRTFTVHLQDPRVSAAHFDLVAVPAHDPMRGENVIVTTATPNRVTPEILQTARRAFAHFEALPSPRVAVLVGGTSKAYRMTPEIAQRLSTQLLHVDSGLMVTVSRRTGAQNEAILRDALKEKGAVFFWDGLEPNPYFGMLAWADVILVTADSASMLSEACTTGRPVYMIEMEGGHPRIDKLHRNLQNLGAMRPFEGRLEHWDYTPLSDSALVAHEIRKRMELAGLL